MKQRETPFVSPLCETQTVKTNTIPWERDLLCSQNQIPPSEMWAVLGRRLGLEYLWLTPRVPVRLILTIFLPDASEEWQSPRFPILPFLLMSPCFAILKLGCIFMYVCISPLQWKHTVLTTEPPGNSPSCTFFTEVLRVLYIYWIQVPCQICN